tara:strand:- start:10963 stop:11727 length:765 start_codon:yes stop_codon:yes gene_type:complete
LLLADLDGVNQPFSAASPNSFANLALWFNADSLALTDGVPVANWIDSSGLGNDALQGTAARQPIFETGILNGRSAVYFDGVDDVLVSTDIEFNSYTFIVVARHEKPFPGSDYRMDLLTKLGNGIKSAAVYYEWSSAGESKVGLRNSVDGGSEFFVRGLANQNQWYIISATYDGIASHLFLDGELVANSPINAGSINNHNGPFQLTRSNAFGHIFMGHMAEVIMYSEALTDLQRVRVECELSLKYNLSVSQGCTP